MHSSSSRLMPGDQAALPQLRREEGCAAGDGSRMRVSHGGITNTAATPAAQHKLTPWSRLYLVSARDDSGVARPLLAADGGRLGCWQMAGSHSSAAGAAGSTSASSALTAAAANFDCGGSAAGWLLATASRGSAACSAALQPVPCSSCWGTAASATVAESCSATVVPTLRSTAGAPAGAGTADDSCKLGCTCVGPMLLLGRAGGGPVWDSEHVLLLDRTATGGRGGAASTNCPTLSPLLPPATLGHPCSFPAAGCRTGEVPAA